MVKPCHPLPFSVQEQVKGTNSPNLVLVTFGGLVSAYFATRVRALTLIRIECINYCTNYCINGRFGLFLRFCFYLISSANWVLLSMSYVFDTFDTSGFDTFYTSVTVTKQIIFSNIKCEFISIVFLFVSMSRLSLSFSLGREERFWGEKVMEVILRIRVCYAWKKWYKFLKITWNVRENVTLQVYRNIFLRIFRWVRKKWGKYEEKLRERMRMDEKRMKLLFQDKKDV